MNGLPKNLGLEIESILRPIDNDPKMEPPGPGLSAYFPEPMTEVAFLQLVKDRMKTEVIRHTGLLDKPIEKVAICGGSGSFLLEDAIAGRCTGLSDSRL